jgi:hypothetical protein
MRQRTYDWENDMFGLFDLDRPACLREPEVTVFATACASTAWLLASAQRAYAKPPAFKVEVRKGDGHASGSRAGIKLPRWAWSRPVIAHEVAHWIDYNEEAEAGEDRAYHGPHWLGWYIELLTGPGGFQPKRLIRSASFYRLRIIPKSPNIAAVMAEMGVAPATA